MKLFDLELDPAAVAAITEHAEREYPNEACGLVFAGGGAVEVFPLRNVQDRYHKMDPTRFVRTSRDAFRVDELQRMRAIEAFEARGMRERVLYHSHCDAGAYFSPEDRAMAVVDGVEMLPGVVNLVVSVRDKKTADLAAYRYDTAQRSFEEQRLGGSDFAARGMESRAAGVSPPWGGGLAPRRVTRAEEATLRALAGSILELDRAAADEVVRLGDGLYSPLTGFVSASDLGGPTPLTLEVTSPPSPGARALLRGPDGELGLIELIEVDRRRIAGPVFVFGPERGPGLSAAETRAELMRRGLRRVLAIVGPAPIDRAIADPDLDGFLSADPRGLPPDRTIHAPALAAEGWRAGLFARNLGATRLFAPAGTPSFGLELWP